MLSQTPVLLIVGIGPNIGQRVAEAFAAKGYRIARSPIQKCTPRSVVVYNSKWPEFCPQVVASSLRRAKCYKSPHALLIVCRY
ncbi:hypothetical protein BKA67DRAFT_558755 [Truncatella angustata]|uniref:Uncharacterized protein n=1 Tax=Truncatella angustata TaxID=152316 RepID=A0A9P8UUQ4_9PEZI|nr:uncharacterized protein BKA67DRAFT_558755 [Truncatella angustata]KAH6658693.1 hypothetical protein BKA67DRAFT_558755 [Truncatella angustata]